MTGRALTPLVRRLLLPILVVWLGCRAAAAAAPILRHDGGGTSGYHALLIANQRYEHIRGLVTPAGDVAALAQVLRDRYGFDVRTLSDATRDSMLDAIQGYREDLGPEDDFLLYYAGHGVIDPGTGRGYWLPVDALDDKKSRWLSTGDVTNELQAMRARHVLVIADSCYSAAMVRDLGIVQRPDAALNKLLARKARRLLTSGGRAPVLDTGSGVHSVFAGALLRALEDNDGTALAWDIYNRLAINVRANTAGEQRPEYNVIPATGDEEGEFVFVPAGATATAASAGDVPAPPPVALAIPAMPDEQPHAGGGAAVPALQLVTNEQFAAFQQDRGYLRDELWGPDGWAWRSRYGVTGPQFVSNRNAILPTGPVVGVSWYEASAYARWLGGELPSFDQVMTECKRASLRVGAWTRDTHPQYPDKYFSVAAGCARDYGPPELRRLDIGMMVLASRRP